MRSFVLLSFCIAITSLCSAQSNTENFKPYEQTIPGSTLKTKMVPIPAGSFLLGSPATEKNREAQEGPQQMISISPFWMGVYEVTRDEFDVFFKDETTSVNEDVDAITRPSPQYVDLSWGMGKEGGYPVNSMSQLAAMMYCRWLYQKTGFFYRLPTEVEWEYACKAGSSTAYYFGDDGTQLNKYAWYVTNSEEKFHVVGQKLPNAWGLYDMLGNVMEWTLDHYTEKRYNTLNETTDPFVAPNSSKYPKTLRGGGFTETAEELRSSKRFHSDPDWNKRDPQIPKSKWWLTEASWVGFRIIRPLNQPSAEEINQFYKKYIGR